MVIMVMEVVVAVILVVISVLILKKYRDRNVEEQDYYPHPYLYSENENVSFERPSEDRGHLTSSLKHMQISKSPLDWSNVEIPRSIKIKCKDNVQSPMQDGKIQTSSWDSRQVKKHLSGQEGSDEKLLDASILVDRIWACYTRPLDLHVCVFASKPIYSDTWLFEIYFSRFEGLVKRLKTLEESQIYDERRILIPSHAIQVVSGVIVILEIKSPGFQLVKGGVTNVSYASLHSITISSWHRLQLLVMYNGKMGSDVPFNSSLKLASDPDGVWIKPIVCDIPIEIKL